MTAPAVRESAAPIPLQLGGRSLGPALAGLRPGAGPAAAPPRDTRATLARLFPYLKPHALPLAGILLLVGAGTGASLTTPWIIGRAVDALRRPGGLDRHHLAVLAAALAGAYGMGFLSGWFQTRTLTAIAQRVVGRLREDLFRHLQRLPLRYFDARSDGDTLSRFANDLESLASFLSQNFANMSASLLQVAGTFILMAVVDPRLCLAALLPAPFGFWMAKRAAGATRRRFGAQQKAMGGLSGIASEMLGGLQVVQAFGREARAERDFSAANRSLTKEAIRAQVLSGVIPPFMGLMNNLSFAFTALAGGWLILHGKSTLGTLTGFALLARQFARPLSEIAQQYNLVQAALAGAERVFETLDEAPESGIPERPDGGEGRIREAGRPRGEIEFSGVGFGYSRHAPVLRDISLRASPGAMIALVGPTGSGKTTLVNLLARFYDVDAGSIRLDGTDIRHLDRRALRRSMGIVLQDAHLFTDSVRGNLLYGNPEAGEAAMREAARLAHAEPLILRLPRGYDTIISGAGTELSQGERQLLTIARALLADPAVLVLDEATSNVDTRTELLIQEALRTLRRGRTCFVIAHRLSTIRAADEILVLDKGSVVERGTHAELLARDGLYTSLHQSQF